jgi:hypothetical protein
MKALFQTLGWILVFLVACAVGLMVLSVAIGWYTERQVVAMVATFPPGTPFSVCEAELRKPIQTITDRDELEHWLRKVTGREDYPIPEHAILHAFSHRGPPYRFILVFTDEVSRSVLQADWCGM